MITHKVNVCIGSDNPDKKLVVKCNDTGANLMVFLKVRRPGKWQDTIEPYKVPAGSTAVIKIAKPDKTFCVSDGEITNGGIFFEMKPQAFTAAGESNAEVSIFGLDGRRLTSATFHIDVTPECIADSKEESENYVDVMAKQIQAAIEAEEKAAEAAEKAVEAAEKAETALGNSTWIGFEMDAEGNLYAILSPSSDASFFLDENGYLGVQMNV